MGLSACCQIFEDIVDPGKKERERAIQEQKQKKEEEKKKLEEIEEKKRLFSEERERKDIKILDNIEKLVPKYIDKYKPFPANKNAKLSFEKKPFMEGTNRNIIKIDTWKKIDNYATKIDEDKYGIMYQEESIGKNFLDIYDCLTQKFLYRITDINGDSVKFLVRLKDGTHYFETFNENNNGILKIIEDKGYQVLYNIYLKGGLLQLHDERIITIEFNYQEKNCFLSLYEKDNDGVYKKIKEKLINEEIYNFIQVRENLLVTKNMDYIYFLEINTLNLLKKITYLSRNNVLVLLNKNYLLLNSLSGSYNMFNLIDIDSMELIKHYSKEELKRLKNKIPASIIPLDIIDSFKLPNGSAIIKIREGMFYPPETNTLVIFWNEKEKEVYYDRTIIDSIPNHGQIDSFIVFEKHNALLFTIGDEKNLYFKN